MTIALATDGYIAPATISGGGDGNLVFPSLSNATTETAIRDRFIELIEAITPEYLPSLRFRRYRHEGEGVFTKWAEDHPASAVRRFSVRFDGAHETPAISNFDHEERIVRIVCAIAYPHDARAGAKQALDRDTMIRLDTDHLEQAIGLYSRQNFSPPHPDACWDSGEHTRVVGDSVDFLVSEVAYRFRRALT